MRELGRQLAAIDPRDAHALSHVYQAEHPRLDILVGCISAGTVDAIAVTWLLKHALEQGEQLSGPLTNRLIAALRDDGAWEAELNICQSVRRMKIDPSQARTLANWLRKRLAHERAFVRAWSLDAQCALARANHRYRRAADEALSEADADPAASVRARVRYLKKALSSEAPGCG